MNTTTHPSNPNFVPEKEPCEGCQGNEVRGIRWPSASDGDASYPFVERCDLCERFEDDMEAASWLADMLNTAVRVALRHGRPGAEQPYVVDPRGGSDGTVQELQ